MKEECGNVSSQRDLLMAGPCSADFLNEVCLLRGQSNGKEFHMTISNKGKRSLVRDSYMFRLDHSGKDKLSWRCSTRGCPAHLKTDQLAEIIVQDNEKPHTHTVDAHRFEKQLLRIACKRKAVEDCSTRTQDIISNEMTRLSGISLSHKNTKFLQLAMYRERKKVFPKMPRLARSGKAFKQNEKLSDHSDSATIIPQPHIPGLMTSFYTQPSSSTYEPHFDMLTADSGSDYHQHPHHPQQHHDDNSLQPLPQQLHSQQQLEPAQMHQHQLLHHQLQPLESTLPQTLFHDSHLLPGPVVVASVSESETTIHHQLSHCAMQKKICYADVRVHEDLLHDKVRTLTYSCLWGIGLQQMHTKSSNVDLSLKSNVSDSSSSSCSMSFIERHSHHSLSERNSFPCQSFSLRQSYMGIPDILVPSSERRALQENRARLKGATVLEVGAGTAILSHFAVQAGALRVYAVEPTGLAAFAERIAKENGVGSVITVIQSNIETAEIPVKVDAIICEWMGHNLLCESTLPSLLVARDRFLRQGGEMYPCTATLYLAPITDKDCHERLKSWKQMKNLYGVSMESAVSLTKDAMTVRASRRHLESQSVLANACQVCHFDLKTMTLQDAQLIKADFNFRCYSTNILHGFASWFIVYFPGSVVLDTSPYALETHWGQLTMTLKTAISVHQDSEIRGIFKMQPSQDSQKSWDIQIEFQLNQGSKYIQQWQCAEEEVGTV